MEEFRRRNFPDRYPAFDGRKNLYSTRGLPEKTDSFMVYDQESVRVKQCEITIKYTSQVNLGSLSTYMSSESTLEIPQKAIQAVDVVLRNATSLKWVCASWTLILNSSKR
ncbi:Protein argonaute 12 [Zootermopsis nevadensis]|uniref:Protein argonaute 12 n=1 Tax=Zootermopsis nevadensis TaxID=136037 RepID=A0A067QX19_ZOONE|nr:Protein argonaute 12 [Zootermopsis nevadensis]